MRAWRDGSSDARARAHAQGRLGDAVADAGHGLLVGRPGEQLAWREGLPERAPEKAEMGLPGGPRATVCRAHQKGSPSAGAPGMARYAIGPVTVASWSARTCPR